MRRAWGSILLVILGTPGLADASSPGMIEGPPGCKVKGRVKRLEEKDGARRIHVELGEVTGSCTYEACTMGTPSGAVVVAPRPGSPAPAPGATVEVWLDAGGSATLEIPACTRTPIRSAPKTPAPPPSPPAPPPPSPPAPTPPATCACAAVPAPAFASLLLLALAAAVLAHRR